MDFNELFPDVRSEGETDLRKAQLVMLRILKIVDFICRKHALSYWIDGGTLLGAVRHKGFIPWDDDLDIAMPRGDYERFLSIALEELPSDLYLQTTDTDPSYDMFGKPPCKIRDEFSVLKEHHKTSTSGHEGIFLDIFPVDRMHRSLPERRVEHLMKKRYWRLCVFYNIPWIRSSQLKIVARNMVVLAVRMMKIRFWLKQYMRAAKQKIEQNKGLREDYKLGFGFDVPWVRYFEPYDIFPLQEILFEGSFFKAPNNYDSLLKQYYGDYGLLPPVEKRLNTHSSHIIIDTRKSTSEAG